MGKKLAVVLCGLLIGSVRAGWANAATTLVAEPGWDTLRPVLEQIRKLPPEARQRGVEVVLKPGVYRSKGLTIGSEHSGLPGAPIVWRAEKPGTVQFSTYAEVPGATFKEESNGVLVAPLKAANFAQMTSPHWNKYENSTVPVPHVIVDGQMMTPATWPNEGWAKIAAFVDQGTTSSNGNTPQKSGELRRGGTFGYSGDRPTRWVGEPYCWLEGYWCFDWALSCIKIREINTVSNTISMLAPHVYGVRQGNPSPRRWRVRHARAELDAPGEYYVDAAEKKLYLVPPKGFDRKRSVVTISSCESVGVTMKKAHDLRWENIDFTESWSQLMEIRQCRRIAVENCRFYNGRAKGLTIDGSSDCGVVGCDFFDLGAGGIWLGHDDIATLKPSRNLVEDCVFRRCSRLRLTYAPGIGAFAAVGATIRHCEVSDQPHIGVIIDGNDMLFEYNVVSNVCYAADDASGYYAGRCPQCQGNEIRYCLFKDIRSRLEKSGMCGVYLDDGQPGHYVHHNIFVNAGRASIKKDGQTSFAGAMYTNAGFSNRCENCIFVDCIQAFSCYQQSDAQWGRELEKGIKSGGEYWRLNSWGGLAFFTNRLYLAKYPMLKDWLTAYKPKTLRENTARNNVVVDCYCRNNPNQGGWDLDESNIVLGEGEDAGFVDRAHGNFALRPDSVIYRKLPRFTPIPFDDIGLLHLRRDLAIFARLAAGEGRLQRGNRGEDPEAHGAVSFRAGRRIR